jgi:hypothetical protein
VVAALDHSEVVTAELASRDRETDEQKAERVEAVIASRVPDTRFLLDHLLTSAALDPSLGIGAGTGREPSNPLLSGSGQILRSRPSGREALDRRFALG